MPKDVVADVEPLDVTGTQTVALGTAIWLIALLLLLPFTGRLRDNGDVDWLWTCVAGIGLGLFGLWYCRRRAQALRTHARDRTGGGDSDDLSG